MRTMENSIGKVLAKSEDPKDDKWRTACWAGLTDEERWTALATLVAAMIDVPVEIDWTDTFDDLKERNNGS